jgi:hypothetical protein
MDYVASGSSQHVLTTLPLILGPISVAKAVTRQYTMPSGHKRALDPVQQVGEIDTGINTSEEYCRENKRSRMQSEVTAQPSPTRFFPAHDNQRSSPFHSSPDNPQLSTPIGRQSDLTINESNISLRDIISTLDILSRAAATNNNPESTSPEPLFPTRMDPTVAATAGEGLISGVSTGDEHLGPANINQTSDMSPSAANSANQELQRQLVQTWDIKRVRELEQQGE